MEGRAPVSPYPIRKCEGGDFSEEEKNDSVDNDSVEKNRE